MREKLITELHVGGGGYHFQRGGLVFESIDHTDPWKKLSINEKKRYR
jgi:hypothetical protein